MKKNDIILIGVILILAAGLYFVFFGAAEAGGSAKLMVDGELQKELSLEEDTTFTLTTKTGQNTVEIKDGYVSMVAADCRDQICVEHRKIQRTGETIVCLPHKLVVEIVGGQDGEFDMVVG